jgi:hypothetical protein
MQRGMRWIGVLMLIGLISGCAGMPIERESWKTSQHFSENDDSHAKGFVEFYTFNKLSDIYQIGTDITRGNPLRIYLKEDDKLKLLGTLDWDLNAPEKAWNRQRLALLPGTYTFVIKATDYVDEKTAARMSFAGNHKFVSDVNTGYTNFEKLTGMIIRTIGSIGQKYAENEIEIKNVKIQDGCLSPVRLDYFAKMPVWEGSTAFVPYEVKVAEARYLIPVAQPGDLKKSLESDNEDEDLYALDQMLRAGEGRKAAIEIGQIKGDEKALEKIILLAIQGKNWWVRKNAISALKVVSRAGWVNSSRAGEALQAIRGEYSKKIDDLNEFTFFNHSTMGGNRCVKVKILNNYAGGKNGIKTGFVEFHVALPMEINAPASVDSNRGYEILSSEGVYLDHLDPCMTSNYATQNCPLRVEETVGEHTYFISPIKGEKQKVQISIKEGQIAFVALKPEIIDSGLLSTKYKVDSIQVGEEMLPIKICAEGKPDADKAIQSEDYLIRDYAGVYLKGLETPRTYNERNLLEDFSQERESSSADY